jgi:hypothetical protein
LIILYNIFYDISRIPNLFEEYLKLLMNAVSESDQIKKSFILTIPGQNETFLSMILNYFNKNLNSLHNNPNFVLLVNLLKSLFQSKNVILSLLRMRFIEDLLKEIEKSKKIK